MKPPLRCLEIRRGRSEVNTGGLLTCSQILGKLRYGHFVALVDILRCKLGSKEFLCAGKTVEDWSATGYRPSLEEVNHLRTL